MTLNTVMLSVTNKPTLLRVIMLSVVMLNVVMLSVCGAKTLKKGFTKEGLK